MYTHALPLRPVPASHQDQWYDCVRLGFLTEQMIVLPQCAASPLSSGSCCAVCESCTYNHRIYSNGQRFTSPDQPCLVCSCQVNASLCLHQHNALLLTSKPSDTACLSSQHGSVECERRPCPPLNCSNSYTPPGECCPKCPGTQTQTVICEMT